MSGATPRVSICIPAYEQVVYLERTLDSIAGQDLTDIEVIVSDDSRGDAVKELVERYRAVFGEKLRYVRNRPALGSPANWNATMALASGELVKIMHHDEWFASPTSLRAFVELMDRSGADAAFSAVRTTAVDEGRDWTLCPSDAEVEALRLVPDRILLANLIGPPSAVIHKRSLGLRYDTRFTYVVDMVFYRELLLHHRVERTPEVLIRSVSGAGHNVSAACQVPDIELREYLEAIDDRWALMSAAVRPAFRRLVFGLLVKYAVTDMRAFRRYHPRWSGRGPYRWLVMKAKAYTLVRPLSGGRKNPVNA